MQASQTQTLTHYRQKHKLETRTEKIALQCAGPDQGKITNDHQTYQESQGQSKSNNHNTHG